MSVPGHDYDGLPEGERDIYAGFRAAEANASAPPRRDEPPPHDGVPPGPPGEQDDGPGPEGCPVVPLGTQGGRFYYLTRLGQMTWLRAPHHTTLGIGGQLFEGDAGPDSWLWRRFPMSAGSGKREKQVGFDATEAAMWLMGQAAACGIVDIASDVRGIGAWADADRPGQLVFHAGDGVLVDGEWHTPGRHGRHLYAGDRRIDRPGKTAATTGDAVRLLKLLEMWRYQGVGPDGDEGAVVPRLVLGWLVAAGVPGALEWRPSIWFSGAAETGKTTLLFLIRQLLGSTALGLAHVTEPGVRQALGVNALAVLIDEFEAPDLGPVITDVMRFVRIASSGRSGAVLKGGMDGIPIFSTLVGAFGFSSIYRPPLTPQDRQRVAFVDVLPLPVDSAARSNFAREIAWAQTLGPALRRRVVDHWHRFPDLLAAYASALEAAGHGHRAREHYGTLLACADLVLTNSGPEAAGIRPIVDQLTLDVIAAEGDGDDPDHVVWMRHLLQSPSPNWRSGEHRPIGRLVADALRLNGADDAVHADLRAVGLKVETDPAKLRGSQVPHLLVANTHPTLGKIFESSTRFRSTDWRQILHRAPGAFAAGQTRFGGDYSGKATAVPISALPIGSTRFDDNGDRNADRNSETGGGAMT